MAFRLEFAAGAERDFRLIFDHLLHSYLEFGESLESALDHAEARIAEIRVAAERVPTAPHRGERHDDVLPGLRHIAIRQAIYPSGVNESRGTFGVLAVIFGGQNQVARKALRYSICIARQ